MRSERSAIWISGDPVSFASSNAFAMSAMVSAFAQVVAMKSCLSLVVPGRPLQCVRGSGSRFRDVYRVSATTSDADVRLDPDDDAERSQPVSQRTNPT